MSADKLLDDRYWDDLSAPLQAAAAVLGYTQRLWDTDQEPISCNLDWSELTHAQQKAARLLGYTPEEWAEDEASVPSSPSPGSKSDDKPDSDGDIRWIEKRIKALEIEITQRQIELKKLVGAREGSAYAHMLHSHEDCVNAHLRQRVVDFHPDLLQNQPPKLERSRLQLVRDAFLHEYHHTLPGFLSMVLHCLLYITLYGFVAKLTHIVGEEFFGSDDWDVIHNNYDDTNEKNFFFLTGIVVSFFLARMTGVIHEWNENRWYRRRVRFHQRNRWHLRCWDMLIIDWFSGGDVSKMYSDSDSARNGSVRDRVLTKWGPRLKAALDIFSFFLLYCSVDHFVMEWGPKSILNVRETVLEGLPSRQMHEQLTKKLGNTQQCVSHDSDECLNIPLEDYSDIWNWVTNSNRCGWAVEEEEDSSDDEDDEADDDDTGDGQFHVQENESGISFSGTKRPTPKQFRPWKQATDEWRRMLNIRDDEYLRETLSLESYYSLVGDPYACFTDPETELLFHAVITGISFGCMYYLGAPFLLI